VVSEGRVLIVEDEAEVADILEFNLRAAGFEVVQAGDGLTACRQVGAAPPDLIILDILLPDLEGWEICRMIRSHPDLTIASIPIVMLTALTSAEDKLRGLDLGADDYIGKPFSVREVVLKSARLARKRNEAMGLHRRVERLEEERRAESDLQSVLFHEVKNKLVVIGGFSNRLASGTVPNERRGDYARAVKHASDYLGSLAEQVLLLRGIQAGRASIPVEEVAIENVVALTLGLHEGPAEEKGLRVTVEKTGAHLAALANPLALRVCVSNLLENAVRCCPPGSRVTVRTGREPGSVHVEVEDDGPGIPEEETHRVFQRFYQGSSAARTRGGTGLGLYMVKTLAEAMGGHVSLSSRPGHGTRVRVELRPSAPENAPESAPDGCLRPTARPLGETVAVTPSNPIAPAQRQRLLVCT